MQPVVINRPICAACMHTSPALPEASIFNNTNQVLTRGKRGAAGGIRRSLPLLNYFIARRWRWRRAVTCRDKSRAVSPSLVIGEITSLRDLVISLRRQFLSVLCGAISGRRAVANPRGHRVQRGRRFLAIPVLPPTPFPASPTCAPETDRKGRPPRPAEFNQNGIDVGSFSETAAN